MKEITVLVVDDDKLNRILITKLLSKYGTTSSQAESGSSALEMIELNHYDYIFMDHNMPRMSGAECAVKIKEFYKSKGEQAPVIVCISADLEHASNEIFDDFLMKPFNVEALKELLSKAGVQ